MKLIKRILLVIFLVLLAACAHTNELAKYDLVGKSIMYKTKVAPDARTVSITTYNSKNYDSAGKKKSTETAILESIASIGESIISSDKEAKLQEMVHPEEMVESISDGMKDALGTYLELNEVAGIQDRPDYICEITLENLQLQVNKNSTMIYVSANSRILDRNSGNLVWEDGESSTQPLSQNYDASKTTKLEEDAINILKLATLDENLVNEMISAAVNDVGYYLAETLRQDIAESKKINN
jgi:hypothetical protein